jgi:tetratricopeptide (TPR) repeat protein
MTGRWQTVRVFISSTFLDMQAERDHLVRFVFPRLREQLLARRIHLVDVDLRWGVTSEQDASEVCREIITECRPRFLCMLGGRYGTIPEGKEVSITADEVHFGVLHEHREKIYALFYFRNGAVTEEMDKSNPGSIRESRHSEKAAKLARLKRDIRNSKHQPFLYRPQWTADEGRLLHLRAFGDRVERDIVGTIDDEFGVQPPEELDEFDEENAAMEAFVEERSERFVLGSRQTALEELLAYASATDGNGYVCVTGACGSGKSALLAHLSQHSTLSNQPSTLLIRHFVGASPGSTDTRRTLRRLSRELKEGCADITADIANDPEELRAAFPIFLRQACVHRRVVILLDAVNQFDPASHSAGLYWLPEELPDNARIILSAPDGPALEDLRRRSRKPREIELMPLTAADGEAIIEEFRRRYRKKFEPDQRAALLAKTDAGMPLYLLAALDELRTLGTYEEINRRIAELPPTTRELFAWILKRLEDDSGFRDASGRRVGDKLVSHFAALLGASRYGLSQRELADLLDAGDPQGNIAALLHLLRPYLMRRGELLNFYHHQFSAAAMDAWLKTDAQRQTAHMQLADYFHSQDNFLESLEDQPVGRLPATSRPVNVRKVAELPWQRLQAKQWPHLADILTDLMFLELAWQQNQEDVLRYWDVLESESHFSMVTSYTPEHCEPAKHGRRAWTPARLLLDTGKLSEAAVLWEAIVDDCRWREDPELHGALNNLAITRHVLRDFDGAMKCYTEQAQLCAARQDLFGLQAAFGNMGNVAFELHDLDRAFDFYKKQEGICRAFLHDNDLQRALGNQGNVLAKRGDLDGAAELYRKQEEICKRVGNQRSLNIAILNKADIAFLRRDFTNAEALAKKATTAFRELGAREYLWGALALLGHIYTRQGLPEAAKSFYNEAELICRELGTTYYLAEMFYKLGVATLGSRDEISKRGTGVFLGIEELRAQFDLQDRTLGYLDIAVTAFGKALEFRPEWPEASFMLGCALESKGCAPDAIAAYEAALQARPDWPELCAHLGSLLVKQEFDNA